MIYVACIECADKADHIITTWNDRSLAKFWMAAGAEVCEASGKIGESL